MSPASALREGGRGSGYLSAAQFCFGGICRNSTLPPPPKNPNLKTEAIRTCPLSMVTRYGIAVMFFSQSGSGAVRGFWRMKYNEQAESVCLLVRSRYEARANGPRPMSCVARARSLFTATGKPVLTSKQKGTYSVLHASLPANRDRQHLRTEHPAPDSTPFRRSMAHHLVE